MTHFIQVLHRGLEILRLLSQFTDVTANKAAALAGLSRGTAYRVLETLCDLGYVVKDRRTGIYSVTGRVLELGHGYREDRWITDIARPIVQRLAASVLWPSFLSTPASGTMMIRITTDYQSPLANAHRLPPGWLIRSITDTAPGQAYLAFCEKPQQDLLIDAELGTMLHTRKGTKTRADTMVRLRRIKTQGYIIVNTPVSRTWSYVTSTVAVPVMHAHQPIASLAVRYYTRSVTRRSAIGNLLPRLQAASAELGQQLASVPLSVPAGAAARR